MDFIESELTKEQRMTLRYIPTLSIRLTVFEWKTALKIFYPLFPFRSSMQCPASPKIE